MTSSKIIVGVLRDMFLPMFRAALLLSHVRYPYRDSLSVQLACQVSIMSIAVSAQDMLLSDGSSVPEPINEHMIGL
jgi:hypothetical protein